MNNRKYTFHEDFSGAGMVRVGLGVNWECRRACDIDAKKCESYRDNFGSEQLFEGDIADVCVASTSSAQLAWASFPCQDTSLAGGYAGLAGERSGVFWAWWQVVERMRNAGKPYDIVCIENVRGLLTSNDGSDFVAIGEALSNAGYCFGAAVIDAALFLPHSRARLFIVGVRGSMSLTGTLAAKAPCKDWHPSSMLTAYDHFTESTKANWFWLRPKLAHIKRISLEEIITDDPKGVSWHTSEQTKQLISMMSLENQNKLREQQKKNRRIIGTLYKRTRNGEQRAEIRFDGVAGCLRTATGGSSRQIVFVVKGKEVRSRLLAPREAARLMGLPDSYILPAKYNDAYHLCGDGVAVPVVQFLAETVFEPILDKVAKCAFPNFAVAK